MWLLMTYIPYNEKEKNRNGVLNVSIINKRDEKNHLHVLYSHMQDYELLVAREQRKLAEATIS